MLLKLARKTITSRPGCLALGAAAMWFADPQQGGARRAQAQQQAQATLKRKAKDSAGQLRHAGNTAQGTVASATGRGSYQPASDTDLREHLRQVIRSLPEATTDVNVDVEDSIVTLRGQVPSPRDREAVIVAIRRVDGVGQLVDLTHLPGEVAPNKAEALRAQG